jgi:hypothetical protein
MLRSDEISSRILKKNHTGIRKNSFSASKEWFLDHLDLVFKVEVTNQEKEGMLEIK